MLAPLFWIISSLIAEFSDFPRDFEVVGDDRAAFSCRNLLVGIKAKDPDIP
jgi:hypothetical protein